MSLNIFIQRDVFLIDHHISRYIPWPSIRFLVSIVCSLRAVVDVDIIFAEGVEAAVNASVVVEAPSRRSVIDLSMVRS